MKNIPTAPASPKVGLWKIEAVGGEGGARAGFCSAVFRGGQMIFSNKVFTWHSLDRWIKLRRRDRAGEGNFCHAFWIRISFSEGSVPDFQKKERVFYYDDDNDSIRYFPISSPFLSIAVSSLPRPPIPPSHTQLLMTGDDVVSSPPFRCRRRRRTIPIPLSLSSSQRIPNAWSGSHRWTPQK